MTDAIDEWAAGNATNISKIENAARHICRLTNPCWSMVDEIMNPKNPMFERANASRLAATGQTEREFYIECAMAAFKEFKK